MRILTQVIDFIFSFKAYVMLPTAIVKMRGLDFPVLDVGWPPLAAITWASPIAPLTIVLVLALNLAMLALVGALVQAVSGSLLLGLAATALTAVYGIVVAYLLISTHFAPLSTTLAAKAGSASVQSYAGEITAFTDGGNPVRLWFYYLFRDTIWALAAIPAVLALMYLCWRTNRRLTKEDTL